MRPGFGKVQFSIRWSFLQQYFIFKAFRCTFCETVDRYVSMNNEVLMYLAAGEGAAVTFMND